MKTKKKKQVVIGIIALVICVCGTGMYFFWRDYQERESLRLDKGYEKKYFMIVLGSRYLDLYKSPEYDEKYWEAFLKEKDTDKSIMYINQYIEEIYPDSPYTELSIEILKKDYEEIYYQWTETMDDYLEKKKKYEEDSDFTRVINKSILEGWHRDIVDMLGYDDLMQVYDYNTTYEEVFLQQAELEIFLNQLNQYMKENYPEIESEDITMERLERTEYDVCDQLWEVKEKLAEEGVDFAEIMREIHGTVVTADS